METAKNEGLNNGVHTMSKGGKDYMDAGRANRYGWPELVLRVLALVLTFIGALLLGLDKQSKIVPFVVSPDVPAYNVTIFAKYTYVSAFVYSVAANAIACTFATVTLALTVASNGGGKSFLPLMIIVADMLMIGLLFSSVGASGAIGIIGFKGNSHLQWDKVCDVFGKFCHQALASVVLSLLAGIAFVLLVILSASKLHKKTY